MEYKNKKLQSPPNEEMELSQRTGRLSIVYILGRGVCLGYTSLVLRICQVRHGAWGMGRIVDLRLRIADLKKQQAALRQAQDRLAADSGQKRTRN